MFQYNSVSINLSNLQLNKLKSGMKNGTLNFSSNVIGDFGERTDFPNRLLLTDRKVSKFCKDFGNNSLANIKSSKTQVSKMVKSGRYDKIT